MGLRIVAKQPSVSIVPVVPLMERYDDEQAREDAEALLRAEEVRRDPARLKAARAFATKAVRA